MESLVQSANQYAQLLKRCRTEEVADWKPQDLERSLHWACFFENVYDKVKLKRSIRSQLDSHLTMLGENLGCLGTHPLCFEFLPHGLNYLLKSLLQNPALSEEMLLLLIKHPKHQHLVYKFIHELAQSKLLLTSLAAVNSRLHQDQ